MSLKKLLLSCLIVASVCAAHAGPAVFDAAITVNGNLTITGGALQATSATTSDGASIILGSLDTQLILDSETSANIVSGVAGRYGAVNETILNFNTNYAIYFLKLVGFFLKVY